MYRCQLLAGRCQWDEVQACVAEWSIGGVHCQICWCCSVFQPCLAVHSQRQGVSAGQGTAHPDWAQRGADVPASGHCCCLVPLGAEAACWWACYRTINGAPSREGPGNAAWKYVYLWWTVFCRMPTFHHNSCAGLWQDGRHEPGKSNVLCMITCLGHHLRLSSLLFKRIFIDISLSLFFWFWVCLNCNAHFPSESVCEFLFVYMTDCTHVCRNSFSNCRPCGTISRLCEKKSIPGDCVSENLHMLLCLRVLRRSIRKILGSLAPCRVFSSRAWCGFTGGISQPIATLHGRSAPAPGCHWAAAISQALLKHIPWEAGWDVGHDWRGAQDAADVHEEQEPWAPLDPWQWWQSCWSVCFYERHRFLHWCGRSDRKGVLDDRWQPNWAQPCADARTSHNQVSRHCHGYKTNATCHNKGRSVNVDDLAKF